MLDEHWFTERCVLWPGQAQSLQVENVLFSGKSDFQDILIFESTTYGRVLVLDGVIQVTERDEFAYQEMIVHLPLFCHPCPKRVLVIGGGDGGVVREIVKHDCVREIVLCEIDKMVVDVCTEYLPQLSSALKDPRVKIEYQDGATYLQEHVDTFDVIVTDSSDPVGPADVLFKESFYEALYASLKADGICCCQGESIWLHMNLIAPLLQSCKNIFTSVGYAYTMVPSYPGGQIGFVLGCKSQKNFEFPCRKPSAIMEQTLKYYSPAIHQAAFVLPLFASRTLKQVLRKTDS
eukprot:jgi/Galph1/2058/GphlegSOOS_G741.1